VDPSSGRIAGERQASGRRAAGTALARAGHHLRAAIRRGGARRARVTASERRARDDVRRHARRARTAAGGHIIGVAGDEKDWRVRDSACAFVARTGPIDTGETRACSGPAERSPQRDSVRAARTGWAARGERWGGRTASASEAGVLTR
jgi:hypothetical protein